MQVKQNVKLCFLFETCASLIRKERFFFDFSPFGLIYWMYNIIQPKSAIRVFSCTKRQQSKPFSSYCKARTLTQLGCFTVFGSNKIADYYSDRLRAIQASRIWVNAMIWEGNMPGCARNADWWTRRWRLLLHFQQVVMTRKRVSVTVQPKAGRWMKLRYFCRAVYILRPSSLGLDGGDIQYARLGSRMRLAHEASSFHL